MDKLSNENWISNRLGGTKVKPKLGRKVYCIYETGIMVDRVGYVGKDSFIDSTE